MPALEVLDGRVDALLTTMLATGGSGAADAEDWDARALAALDVPVLQAVCATTSRAAWLASDSGLKPLDAATQVAIPEFDGRLLGGVVSFKERDADGAPRLRARPRALRARRAARRAPCAAAHDPAAARRRVADELPDQARPGRHGGRARHAGERARAARRALERRARVTPTATR